MSFRLLFFFSRNVFPEQISYSNNATDAAVQNVTQLGPSFTTTFTVRNSGPSTVREISLTINWPIQTIGANSDTYFLYPAAVSVRMYNAIINFGCLHIPGQSYELVYVLPCYVEIFPSEMHK